MKRLKTLLVFLTAALGISTALIGCGGGGGSSDTGNSSGASVTLSGTVTYTYYSVNQTTGIVYNSPTEKPIRGAVVALQNSSGTVLATTNTSQTGSYSFSAPANSTVKVVVKAALGSPDSPRVTVVDNTNGGALYGTYLDVTTGTVSLTANFNANSVWGGTSYSGERAAAPFAILDTIYQAEALIKIADPNVQFPALVVNWSKNNKPTSGNKAIGEIGTSHYQNGNLYILGAEGLDTDEYDTHVMAHEWGHYFEGNLGRSDSIGGSHGPEDILDPRVAFGEGWGNALAGMVLNDPIYIDTSGASQATIGLKMNVDTDSVLDTQTSTTNTNYLVDGFYSEASVQEVLYDLFDSGTSDDDSLSLGFKPIYDVMVGGQKTTPAYTTIFSFLKYLKDANPTNSTAIATLAAAENIGTGDEYEATLQRIYTAVPVDGTIVTTDVDLLPLQTWADIGPITADPGNKLFNRMFFKFTISAAGSHTIVVTPLASRDVFFVLNEKGAVTQVDQSLVGATETLTKSLAAGDYVMEVGSFGGAATFTVKIN